MHVDLKKSPGALSGGKGEYILEAVGISCNKNTVPGDQSALNPSGVRFGTPALTTRGDLRMMALMRTNQLVYC